MNMSWLFDDERMDPSKKGSEEIYREKIGDVRIRIDKIIEKHSHPQKDVDCTPKKEPAE